MQTMNDSSIHQGQSTSALFKLLNTHIDLHREKERTVFLKNSWGRLKRC